MGELRLWSSSGLKQPPQRWFYRCWLPDPFRTSSPRPRSSMLRARLPDLGCRWSGARVVSSSSLDDYPNKVLFPISVDVIH